MATKRLAKELSLLERGKNEPNKHVYGLGPVDESNLYEWRGWILGGDDDDDENNPYANGKWEIEIKLSELYPNNPPNIKFKTRICHPNIDFLTGEICIDLLTNKGWSPILTISSLCDSIYHLLFNSNSNSPLDVDVSCLSRLNDLSAYNSLIAFYTHQYASM